MKTTQEIETELRNVYQDAIWDKRFTKIASKIIEEIRKENGFEGFTTKERVAIVESINHTLMHLTIEHSQMINKLKREFLYVYTALVMIVICIVILTLKVYK